MTANDTPDLAATIAELERLDREAFRAPWTYSRWEVECEACEAGTNEPETGCPDPDCDGTHAPLTCIESPEEYPGGQVVAQFKVPGLLSLADKNGALIVALRNAAPQLLSAASLAQELTALLGPEPVGRAKELVENATTPCFDCGQLCELYRGTNQGKLIGIRCGDCGEVFCGSCVRSHFKQSARNEQEAASLRAALSEKEAELTRAHGIIGQLQAEAMKLELEENARLRERLADLESAAKYWEKRWREDTGITPQDER